MEDEVLPLPKHGKAANASHKAKPKDQKDTSGSGRKESDAVAAESTEAATTEKAPPKSKPLLAKPTVTVINIEDEEDITENHHCLKMPG
uniref:Uncharacterized protein n=1 Tax=Moniliophthora roreri TaxID=221103 RepID=A0A0W0F761_MONRR